MSNPSAKYNSDSYTPAWEDDGRDDVSPEFDAVRSSDSGFDCREDAYDMALLKYCAECGI